MIRSALRILAVGATLAATPALEAQPAGRARIVGTVTDSVHARPAAGATVLLTRLTEPTEFRGTLTDRDGRYHFDTLSAGRYSIAFATAYLDSLTVAMPPREVELTDGGTARLDFATPSGATIRAAVCPGVTMGRAVGAVIGQVSHADTDRPLPTARVAVSWNELGVDSATLKPVTSRRGGIVPVDSLGHYRLCGVPTDTYLMLQVQDSGHAGSVLTLTVDHDGGVLVRDLSLSVATSASIASLDSVAAAAAAPFRDTTHALRLTGTASLAGIVRSSDGQPLTHAQVRVRDAAGVTFTDSLGRFSLSGLPAGSQLLDVRHVGYLLGLVPVELRAGRSVDVAVSLRRIVSLDSIRIVARRTNYSEFEKHRKEGFGRFLDEQQVENLHVVEVSEIFRRMTGFRVEGEGLDTHLFTTHGAFERSALGPCEVNVVIDGINQHQDINLIDPREIAAVEAYPGVAGAPVQYDRACGVIVIWIKR